MPTSPTRQPAAPLEIETDLIAALAMIADTSALGDAAGQRFGDRNLLEAARGIARTALDGRSAELPIQVLELHIHDEDVCANCSYPLALNGHCVCGDWQPTSSLFVIAYRDIRATISSNLPANRQSLTHRIDRCPHRGWAKRRARVRTR